MSEPIFLCTMGQYNGDVSDERAIEQLELLGSILNKLGFQLESGQAPNFHELWARPMPAAIAGPPPIAEPPPAAVSHGRPGRLTTAAEFERTFLAWLHITHGVFPEEQAGTNAYYWRFTFGDSEVSVAIIGQGRNTATPPSDTDWALRVEESEPAPFTQALAPHFAKGLRRVMPGGRIRMQFKSIDLIAPFDDQTGRT